MDKTPAVVPCCPSYQTTRQFDFCAIGVLSPEAMGRRRRITSLLREYYTVELWYLAISTTHHCPVYTDMVLGL